MIFGANILKIFLTKNYKQHLTISFLIFFITITVFLIFTSISNAEITNEAINLFSANFHEFGNSSLQEPFLLNFKNSLQFKKLYLKNEINNHEKKANGRVWGGVFLATGVACTVYGLWERGVFYNWKDVVREEKMGDVNSVSYFTLYNKTHANPHTALLTSLGLFLNSSYWMLKDRIEGVNLEEYSDLFSQRKMAWYSIAFGSLVAVVSSFNLEYIDNVRRGYREIIEPNGRKQYFSIQDEHREFSYKQYSVNMASSLIYVGFGIWKLLAGNISKTNKLIHDNNYSKLHFSFSPSSPLPLSTGIMLRIQF